jgi:hypothetical protein
VDDDNPNYSSDSSGVLFNKDKTTLIKYPEGRYQPEYSIPSSVVLIDRGAFSDTNIKSVVFEENSRLQIIEDSAFSSCRSLEKVTVPKSVTLIDKNAFYSCLLLNSFTFEEGSQLETIGSSAFVFCTTLESIILPEKVRLIGERAFSNCSSFSTIKIPKNVASIGQYAFSGCSLLETIKFTSVIPPVLNGWVAQQVSTVIVPKGTENAYRNAQNVKWSTETTFLEFEPLVKNVTVEDGIITGIDFDSYGGEVIIVAFYDEADFVGVKILSVSNASDVNISIPEAASKIKFMLWDGFHNMPPLCNAVVLKKHDFWESDNIAA